MAGILEQYNDFISSGDPYVRQFFLLRSIKPMVFCVTFYVLFVTYVGPLIMRKRKAMELRKLIIFYNFAIVIYYVYFLLGGAYFLYHIGPKLFCDSTLDSRKNPLIANFYFHGYVLYASKYVELIDTVFLVLSKKFKTITPLHVFHHSIVPVVWWFGFRTEKSACLSAFMVINSIVHVIMYLYYALAALGPEYQKYLWWKKYLTFFQIAQFFVSSIYVTVMYSVGCVTSRFLGICAPLLMVVFFFWFIEFYVKTFKTPAAKKGLQNGSDVQGKTLPIDKTK